MFSLTQAGHRQALKKQTPKGGPWGLFFGRLAVTYFRAGNPHYHRRRVVSPSCSGWEGVGPPRYGRQAKLETGNQKLETSKISALVPGQIWKKFFGFEIGNNKHFALELLLSPES